MITVQAGAGLSVLLQAGPQPGPGVSNSIILGKVHTSPKIITNLSEKD